MILPEMLDKNNNANRMSGTCEIQWLSSLKFVEQISEQLRNNVSSTH